MSWEPKIEKIYENGVLVSSTIQRTPNGPKEVLAQPQQRTWVGLTPEEIDSLANLKVDGAYLSVPDTIRQTDAKLKEKNT